MKKRDVKQGRKVYLIKVILSDWYGKVRGQPFRVLAIPEDFTLYSLAEAIVDGFNFDFDHPFGFYDNIKRWPHSNEGYELFADLGEGSEFKGVKITRVNKVFNKVGKKMLFLFDYGDKWHFSVELKGIELPKEGEKYPLIVASVGGVPLQYGEADEGD